jgi:hypothetical protein
MALSATEPTYPPITPELRDAILAAFAGFTPGGDE